MRFLPFLQFKTHLQNVSRKDLNDRKSNLETWKKDESFPATNDCLRIAVKIKMISKWRRNLNFLKLEDDSVHCEIHELINQTRCHSERISSPTQSHDRPGGG
jgi:hypothetical protein